MHIRQVIDPRHAVVGLKATDKTKVMLEVAGLLSGDETPSADAIAEELLKREMLGSTAFGDGVAMPHARIQDLKQPIGLAARLRKRIDFNAIDDQPVDLVIALLLPLGADGQNLNTLACVARSLRDPGRLERLRSAAGNEAFYRALTD